MKRVFMLLTVLLSMTMGRAMAQETTPIPVPAANAAAIAAQQAAEEHYKRMAADLQAVQMDNESLKAKISTLEQSIENLRRQQAAAANNTGVQEDLKNLAEKIAEVDRKREADKQATAEEIRNFIGKLKTLAAPAPTTRAAAPKIMLDAPTPTAVQNGFAYTIKDGDTLSVIVKAYNADFKSKGWKTITLKQTREANPNVDWDRLRVGQKIIIPRPEGS